MWVQVLIEFKRWSLVVLPRRIAFQPIRLFQHKSIFILQRQAKWKTFQTKILLLTTPQAKVPYLQKKETWFKDPRAASSRWDSGSWCHFQGTEIRIILCSTVSTSHFINTSMYAPTATISCCQFQSSRGLLMDLQAALKPLKASTKLNWPC